MGRKIVQLVPQLATVFGISGPLRLYALCDDGTLWYRDCNDKKDSSWKRVEDEVPNV